MLEYHVGADLCESLGIHEMEVISFFKDYRMQVVDFESPVKDALVLDTKTIKYFRDYKEYEAELWYIDNVVFCIHRHCG